MADWAARRLVARVVVLALLLLVIGGAVGARLARAGGSTTYTVNDGGDGGGDGNCINEAGCTLRRALAFANSDLSSDTILIAVPTVTLTGDGGQLFVLDSVMIMPANPSTETVVIDASGLTPRTRVLFVLLQIEVILERLTITGGQDSEGGGILIASGKGGPPDVTLRDTTISGNTATNGPGGGLLVEGGTVLIQSSTITANVAGSDGGGIAAFGGASALNIQNSTIHNNTSNNGVGGVHSGEADLFLQNATVSANVGLTGPRWAGVPAQPQNLDGTISIVDSIVAEGSPRHCGSSVASVGGNVFDGNDESCANGPTFAGLSDQVVADAGLLPLADNGGPTQTRALEDGSPAVNSIPASDEDPGGAGAFAQAANCRFPEDQRGEPRPALGDCDSGAYELQSFSGGPGPTRADLAVDKTGPAQVMVGDEIAYTITVTNSGPNLAQGVELSDALPAGVDFVSASPGCTEAGGAVTCALGALAANATTTVDVVVGTTAAGAVTNIVTVDAITAEPDNTDNSDDHLTDVVEVARCAGLTRITTAIQCSVEVFADGSASDVVLTRADLFPDAQAGTPLAVDLGGPMLLSEPAALNADTEEEILRVLAPGGTVHLLGGAEALSQAVEDRLAELGIATVRYPGANRFGTAVLIADALGNPDVVLVANGGDFPDSVVAGAAAVVAGAAFNQATPDIAAVLLSAGADLPPETAAYLAEHQPTVVAVGGGAAEAVPDATEAIVGADRFETSALVAERFFPSPSAAGVATGLVFADALVGGAILGTPAVGPGPMLLTDPDTLPEPVAAYLEAHNDTLDSVLVFGGTAAVSEDVEAAIAELLAAD